MRIGPMLLGMLLLAAGALAATPLATGSADTFRAILGDRLDPDSVVGTPVQVGDLVLIPVVMRGFAVGACDTSRNRDRAAAPPSTTCNFDRDDREAAGGMGFVRPVSLIVIDKTGRLEIHNLQANFLVEMIERLLPLARQVIGQRFEMMRRRLLPDFGSPSPAPVPAPPSAPPPTAPPAPSPTDP